MTNKYQAGRLAGICEVAEKVAEVGHAAAMMFVVKELREANMSDEEIEGEYPGILAIAGMDCPYDFAHTKWWCGYKGCRDA